MKEGVVHRIPLSEQAFLVLERVKGLNDELVYPSPRKQTILSDTVAALLNFQISICSHYLFCAEANVNSFRYQAN